jgi:hypothetical protein
MDEIEQIEQSILFKYWETLCIKKIVNIPSNKYLKKPYLEEYIIDLSKYIKKEELYENIKNKINDNLAKEDIIIFISNMIDFDMNEKKIFQKFVYKKKTSKEQNNFISNVIYFIIIYYRFYMTITEFLFDSRKEDIELYQFIFLLIKNNKDDIQKKRDKDLNFNIFFYCFKKLLNEYLKIMDYLISNDLYRPVDKVEIFNNFFQKVFCHWYEQYKKDIVDNNIINKIGESVIDKPKKSRFFSNLLCFNVAEE